MPWPNDSTKFSERSSVKCRMCNSVEFSHVALIAQSLNSLLNQVRAAQGTQNIICLIICD